MLQLDNLDVGYSGEAAIISNVSIDLPSPGRYALMGPSGSGKTTLLKTLAGLLKQKSGTIRRTGNKRITLLFQEDRLLTWCSVLKNVMLAMPEPSKLAAEKILSNLEIDNYQAYLH